MDRLPDTYSLRVVLKVSNLEGYTPIHSYPAKLPAVLGWDSEPAYFPAIFGITICFMCLMGILPIHIQFPCAVSHKIQNIKVAKLQPRLSLGLSSSAAEPPSLNTETSPLNSTKP